MDGKPIKILLIEDNPADARLVKELLLDSDIRFELVHVKRLGETELHIGKGGFELVLLDLMLPDSEGLVTFVKVHQQFPDLPVVVLTSLADEKLAAKTVQKGAQDYLVKGTVDSDLLALTIRSSIEHRRAKKA